jgi:hypothetical protein
MASNYSNFNNIFIYTDGETDDVLVGWFVRNFVLFDKLVIMTTLGNPLIKASYLNKICDLAPLKDKIRFCLGKPGIKSEYVPGDLPVDSITDQLILPTDIHTYLDGQIVVLMIANPAGSETVLESVSDRITQIHYMGGWYSDMRSSFNSSINLRATDDMYKNYASKLTIYPSYMYRECVGMVNSSTYPKAVDTLLGLDRCRFILALWDYHCTKQFTKFTVVTPQNVCKQFTPADLVAVMVLAYPNFITETKRFDIETASNGLVTVTENPSGIETVTRVDKRIFEIGLTKLFESITPFDPVTDFAIGSYAKSYMDMIHRELDAVSKI